MESITEIFSWLFTQLSLGIFPEGSLDQSIVTPVWVGVIVVAFFNQRLGWTFSGLVVPGYLAPLIIAKPISALIILGESMITYLIVFMFSEILSRIKMWSSLFGRDRFFALIIVSVVVRLTFDGYLLPMLGSYMEENYAVDFDYRSNLHSLGLFIVALTANLFWYKGILRCIIPISTTLLVTLLIVRYGLMEFTNFNIGSLEYMYSDFALSLEASPKAYIIIITCALISSRMNLMYGWDFNGILVPALITLYWYEPLAILFTLLEMCIVLFTATIILKLPFMANKTVEKSNKVMLFFHVAFAYRFVVGYLFLGFGIASGRATDLFGIGYLVSTLMAVKIHEKQIFWRLVRANVQTSVVAAIVANVFGFVFVLVPWSFFSSKQLQSKVTEISVSNESLQSFTKKNLFNTYKTKVNSAYLAPSIGELNKFEQGISEICKYLRSKEQESLTTANIYLQNCGYHIYKTPKYLYLQDTINSGRGTYVFRLQNKNNLVISSPTPLKEKTFLPASHLFDNLQANILAIAGTDNEAVIASSRTFFHRFHMVTSTYNYDILQVRSLQKAPQNGLWVSTNVSRYLNLQKLQQLLGKLDIFLRPLAVPNIQRANCTSNFLELTLHEYASFVTLDEMANNEILRKSISDYVNEHKEKIAPRNSNLYQIPQLEELLFFDEIVLTPLVREQQQFHISPNIERLQKKLQQLNVYASYVGYKAVLIKNKSGCYVILQEKTPQYKKFQGMYILRFSKFSSYLIQVPRPILENSTLQFAYEIFMEKKAFALAISGAHLYSNRDNSSDLLARNHKVNLLNLFYQVLLRENAAKFVLAIQVRGFSLQNERQLPQADVLLSSSQQKANNLQMSVLTTRLLQQLQSKNLSVEIVTATDETSAYTVQGFFQAKYLDQLAQGELVALWLSPYIRSEYRERRNNFKIRQLKALFIPQVRDISRFMINRNQYLGVSPIILTKIQEYLQYQDAVLLHKLLKKSPYKFFYYVDDITGKVVVLLCKTKTDLPIIVNLSPNPNREIQLGKYTTYTQSLLRNFIKSRYSLFIPKRKKQ